MRFLKTGVELILCLLAVICLCLALFFETLTLTLVCLLAAAVLAMGAGPLPKSWPRRRVAAVCLAVIVPLMGLMVWQVIGQFDRRDEAVADLYLDPQGNRVSPPVLPRTLAILFPERDLMKLAMALAPVFPFPTGGVILEELRAQTLEDNMFLPEYRAMMESPHRHRHAVLPLQAFQTLGFSPDVHHVAASFSGSREEEVPVILFLHGYLGQFQFYNSWFAEFEGYLVISPSTRSLNGRHSGDLAWLMDTALPAIAREMDVRIDEDRIHIVGLSNGGLAVSDAALTMPERFASFTWLSSLPPEDLPPIFGEDPSTRLLVIYGTRDFVAKQNTRAISAWSEAGVPFEELVFPGEGHLIMLTRQEKAREALRALIAED